MKPRFDEASGARPPDAPFPGRPLRPGRVPPLSGPAPRAHFCARPLSKRESCQRLGRARDAASLIQPDPPAGRPLRRYNCYLVAGLGCLISVLFQMKKSSERLRGLQENPYECFRAGVECVKEEH